jgi:hypothetical protein
LGSPIEGKKGIDNKTLLQVDGSMVVGALFILTLTTYLSGSETGVRILIGVITFGSVAPFVWSAVLILSPVLSDKEAKNATLAGFFSFAIFLGLLVASPFFQSFIYITSDLKMEYSPFADLRYECAKDPERFNLTAEPWKCSNFIGGSLVERCARIPETFNASLSDCSKFITPSS